MNKLRLAASIGPAFIFILSPASISGVIAQEKLKTVLLSELWKPSGHGVVIQANKETLLVIDKKATQSIYGLNGARLIIRAAHVQLQDDVVIASWSPVKVPEQQKSKDRALDGTAGKEGDPAKEGGNGDAGANGADGETGGLGFPGTDILINFGEITGGGSLSIDNRGGPGARGQNGQAGGIGGTAGRGGKARNGFADCTASGGDAGYPGKGGEGGKGGKGGTGGRGGVVRISAAVSDISDTDSSVLPTLKPKSGRVTIYVGGGKGGDPGVGGKGGGGGDGNDGGAGEGFCGGGNAKNKANDTQDQIETLGPGNDGLPGRVVVVN